MRIARYSVGDQIHYGTVELAADGGPNPDTVADLTGDPMVGPVNLTGARHALADVRLLAPVIPRSKVVGLAHNYSPDRDPDPPAEGTAPELFVKPNTSVIGPDEPIVIPKLSADTGLEGEVAVVIGRICRHVPLERVPEVIFGYTIVNDVTARDFIKPGEPWGIAKGFDNFTPLGPWIATHLSLEAAENLAIRTRVGDTVVQDGTTRRLRWPIGRQLAYISDVMTLLPGDVVLTGTPAGAVQIEPGQVLSVDVEEIGTLVNPVVAEEA
jgi:2-keto-4-pentenoate hydratase/2-oxohepta-3-ene-1,7-dioic acid hydratase in catechol pathway